jgi:anaerobic selenocysteine-containing dehydrogenase
MATALDGVELFVAQDQFLSPTARYTDVVLPATTFWEGNDVHTPWAGAGHYTIFMQQPIAPVAECRKDIDLVADLARRVGIEGSRGQILPCGDIRARCVHALPGQPAREGARLRAEPAVGRFRLRRLE